MMDWFYYEKQARNEGFQLVCGVDEAGRGPLAGPVFAAAVILPEQVELQGINDSKKLSEKKRELLFDQIVKKAAAYSVASADEKEIDQINISNATFLAMKRAVQRLSLRPDMVLVDGDRLPQLPMASKAIVKGDALSISIAAASILAKVSRDRVMVKLSEEYPEYGFEKHKGYPTALHREAILKYGVLPIHRRSFLKKIVGATH